MAEKRSFPKWLPVVLVPVAVGVATIWVILRDVNDTCIYSYVSSVQKAVDIFHQKNQRYPDNLTEIDQAGLDYDCGIQLSELDYEITDKGARVSYVRGKKRIHADKYLTKSN